MSDDIALAKMRRQLPELCEENLDHVLGLLRALAFTLVEPVRGQPSEGRADDEDAPAHEPANCHQAGAGLSSALRTSLREECR